MPPFADNIVVMKHALSRYKSLAIIWLFCAGLSPALAVEPLPPLFTAATAAKDHQAGATKTPSPIRRIAYTAPLALVDGMTPAPIPLDLISIEHVFFAFDKADLDERAQKTLDDTVSYLRRHQRIYRVLIEGNTDARADEAYNDTLADRRTRSVRSYLTGKGIPASLLYTTGLGENRPVDENWTRQGRRRNRHVEIYLLAHPTKR